MEKLKAFFAKDVVKIIAGGIYLILNGLLIGVFPEGPTKQTLIYVWNMVIAPLAVTLGIVSGGTSNLRSNQSVSVTAQLVEKGVVSK